MRKTLLLLYIFSSSFYIFGQSSNDESLEFEHPEIFTFGVGVGFNSFLGDLNYDPEVSTLTTTRPAFFFNIEKRIGSILSLQLETSTGLLSINERDTSIMNNRNFESKLFLIGANLIINLDNDIIINKKSPFAPYFSVGFTGL